VSDLDLLILMVLCLPNFTKGFPEKFGLGCREKPVLDRAGVVIYKSSVAIDYLLVKSKIANGRAGRSKVRPLH
jgi:hypothetical protein